MDAAKPPPPPPARQHSWTGPAVKTASREACIAKFAVQVAFGLLLVVFSMYQIANKVENKEIYFTMLSSTVATFFPHPNLNWVPGVVEEAPPHQQRSEEKKA